jgi:hypothetical protein
VFFLFRCANNVLIIRIPTRYYVLWNFVLTVSSSAIVWTLEILAETTTSAANMSYVIIILFWFDRWRISHAKIIRYMNTSKDKIDRNKNVVSVHIRCSNCSVCPYSLFRDIHISQQSLLQRISAYYTYYDIYVLHYYMHIAIA